MADQSAPQGLLLSDDLLFTSRITATARALGLGVQVARAPEVLVGLARVRPPGGVLVDLHHGGLDLPGLLTALKEACPVMPRVVGYGSHVDAATLRAARQAGCDLVLPRSKFVEELEAALPGWLSPPGNPGVEK